MTDARLCAVNALGEQERRKAYSDALLGDFLKNSGLSPRDSALSARLYYGVLQNRLLLDAHISAHCASGVRKLHPKVRNILRVGAYQLLFCDKIPSSAAVNEAVREAKITGNAKAAGLVNAVLRRISEDPDHKFSFSSETERLSVTYSHPAELVRLLSESVPDTEALLRADNSIPPVSVRANTLRISPSELARTLSWAGAKELTGSCLELSALGGKNPAELPEYREGLFSIQDAASYLAVKALDPRPGELVIDGAAAPGGKALCAAEMSGDRARILAFDIYEDKLQLIRSNAERLGIKSVTAALRDAAAPDPELFGRADRVLADLPCSGLGIIRKKPDIRFRDLSDIAELPALQLRLLRSLSKYVRPGGTLVYSTCTVLARENSGVLERFLSLEPDFVPEGFFSDMDEKFRADSGRLTLLPHIHGTDGFFIAKLARKA
ncbi:MAG: 16S rRNA (cytosine(967)-C(5))-methyltransferase RsmB [Clostridiales bacterium]|nr:16S rRNA (cytosine(967)-C(5))-methyltransferase RsmB [Clostridiales bacterium]